jgi:hypothetical protein
MQPSPVRSSRISWYGLAIGISLPLPISRRASLLTPASIYVQAISLAERKPYIAFP